MEKTGGTGQSAKMRKIQKTGWGDILSIFQFVDFCQLSYFYFPYFKELL